ncbi:hypothetical protein HALLA_21255 (plasmid) [Halostagnicola larsenii XH-48]|uniref:Uncharacterized protein n=1 Tax=Halostagnicola larsenii XH-48 TaxID=797299 RepID=W0JV38_9EURY|nr:hypothetical protein HALLA_21255 [Halostagnicola larsenii XH-48]
MISATPSLSLWALSSHRPADFESLLEQYVTAYAFYGSGKIALRDGLKTISTAGQNVLLPAYLPDAVAEPIVELGLEPRFYAITESLGPNVDDLRSRIDTETAAMIPRRRRSSRSTTSVFPSPVSRRFRRLPASTSAITSTTTLTHR